MCITAPQWKIQVYQQQIKFKGKQIQTKVKKKN